MGSKSGPDKVQTATNRVFVPPILRPLLTQQIGVAGDALGQLSDFVSEGDFVAPFNTDQQLALGLTRGIALGQGGALPTAISTIRDSAQGIGGLNLGREGISQLRGTAAGGGGIPGSEFLTGFLGGGSSFSPTARASSAAAPSGGGGGSLGSLQSIAAGEGLESEPFQNAFNAAVRDIQPQLSSGFSLSGRTGSGLAEAARSHAVADAFAGLFGQERNRQLSASQTLAGLGESRADRALRSSLGFGQLDLGGRELALRGRGQDIGVANALAGLSQNERARELQAAGVLAGLSDSERQRQLNSALALPGIALAGPNALLQIGNQLQAQQQKELTAPLTGLDLLLTASGGGIPLQSLLGSSGSQVTPTFTNPASGALGGAATGATIGSVVPGIGTGIGALVGGGLGLLGAL